MSTSHHPANLDRFQAKSVFAVCQCTSTSIREGGRHER